MLLMFNKKHAIVIIVTEPVSLIFSAGTPSQKFSSRTNRGEVQCQFGDSTNVSWNSREEKTVSITTYDPNQTIRHFKYMFQKVADRAIGSIPFYIVSVNKIFFTIS